MHAGSGVASATPSRRAAWAAVEAAGVVAIALVLVPLQPAFFRGGLDSDFVLGLNLAFERGLRAGSELVFTFGPLGFLYGRAYYPTTWTAMLAAWLFLAAVYAAAAVVVARRSFRRPAWALAWLLILTLAAGQNPDAFLGSFALLLLAVQFGTAERSPAPVVVGLAASLAILSLVKFTFAVGAAVALGAVSLDDLLRRRPPLALAAFMLALTVLWVACGQGLGDAWPYVTTSLEISGAYTQAMIQSGPYHEVALAALLAAFLVWIVLAVGRATPVRAALEAATLALVLFLQFKAGFVRHDAHALVTLTTLLLVAALLGARVAAAAPSRRVRIASVVALIGASALVWEGLWFHRGRGLPQELVAEVRVAAAAVPAALRLAGGTAALRAEHERAFAEVRAKNPIAPARGRVDIYPWHITIPVAHGLDYAPRPVMQSYVAYTPRLAELNAAYLRGPRAPESILVQLAAVDERYPSIDDARSWLEMWTRYDVTDYRGEFLLLTRRTTPRHQRIVPLETRDGRLGEAMPVPDVGHEPLWVAIDVQPTLLGRVATALWRAPKVRLTVRTGDGAITTYRLIPSLAASGFLLSPVVASATDFALFDASGQAMGVLDDPAPLAEDDLVTSLTVTAMSGAGIFHRDAIRVSFARLEMDPRPVPEAESITARVNLALLARAAVHSGIPRDTLVTPKAPEVLFAHAPATIRLPLGHRPDGFRIRYGMLDGAWSDGGKSDGVAFRVSAVVGGETVSLWSRRLDPVNRPDDRGPQTVVLPGPPAGTEAIVFETQSGSTPVWDWSYWSEVTPLDAAPPPPS